MAKKAKGVKEERLEGCSSLTDTDFIESMC